MKSNTKGKRCNKEISIATTTEYFSPLQLQRIKYNDKMFRCSPPAQLKCNLLPWQRSPSYKQGTGQNGGLGACNGISKRKEGSLPWRWTEQYQRSQNPFVGSQSPPTLFGHKHGSSPDWGANNKDGQKAELEDRASILFEWPLLQPY